MTPKHRSRPARPPRSRALFDGPGGAFRPEPVHRDLDPESLLQIPLVRQAYSDPGFRFLPRSTDVRWTYGGHVPLKLAGFNPFEFAHYHGANSRFAAWLNDPFGSARDLNRDNQLVSEVLFMVHDYLHAWAYSVIDRLAPALRVLDGAITPRTFDDYVFCHLLTEAVATVGLDYWQLSERGVDQFCPIGSDFGPLTVSYREAHLAEYRRFCPDWEVQTPEFFALLATFYCSGEFPGFRLDHVRRSPVLLNWLRKELTYGDQQRSFTRQWFSYLADKPVAAGGEWNAPVATETKIRRQLIAELGRLLWAKVKDGDPSTRIERPRSLPARTAPLDKPADFRFVNLARVAPDDWPRAVQAMAPEHFLYFFYQFLAQIPLEAFPRQMLKHLPLLVRQHDVSLVVDFVRDLPRREALDGEPRDLFVVN